MTIASGVRQAGVAAGFLIGIALACTVLTTGTHRVARSAGVQSAYAFIPVQLAMGNAVHPAAPPARKRTTVQAKPQAGVSPQEQKRFQEMLNRMTPKERKRLEKAVKRMTPEQRQQFAAAVKQQLAKPGTAAQTARRAR